MASDAIQNIRFDDVRNRRVLVALSGGADSVALLTLLHDRRDELGLQIFAAHFHHGIRAGEADLDAAFCAELCQTQNIPLLEGRADIPGISKAKNIGLETAAREERYAFLRRAKEQTGAELIALAHHLDDQAETVLMHLLRGCGPAGIGGMERICGDLYRPLLDVPKRALIQFLEARHIAWREDATNRISDNPRNALRLNVLPEIEKSYPAAASAVCRYARIARIENDFLDRMARDFLEARLQCGPYGKRILLQGKEEETLLRRALRMLAGYDISAEKVDALVALARQERGKLEISGKLRAEKTPSALYFLSSKPKQTQEIPLRIPGNTLLPGNCTIDAETGIFPFDPENPDVELFDPDALEGAVLRLRRNGDRFHPLGAPGDRLLSDYLTDRKIDRPLREVLPLIAKGDRVLWVCGVGMSHTGRVKDVYQRSVRLNINYITDEIAEVLL